MLLHWGPRRCPWRTILTPVCSDAGFMETSSLSRAQNDRGSVPTPFAGAQNWAYRLHTSPISALPSPSANSQHPVPPAPPTSVGHAAGYAELPDPFGPLPSPLAQPPPLGSGLKASSFVGLEGTQHQQRGQRPVSSALLSIRSRHQAPPHGIREPGRAKDCRVR